MIIDIFTISGVFLVLVMSVVVVYLFNHNRSNSEQD